MPSSTPLIPLAHNCRRNHELSQESKKKIWEAAQQGERGATIALREGLQRRTVQGIIRRGKTHNTPENKPRTGRSPLLSTRDSRTVFRLVRCNPKWTFDRLKSESGLDFGRTTYKKLLQEHGIKYDQHSRQKIIPPRDCTKDTPIV